MSTIKADALQLGANGTATSNFVWQTNNDGTAKLTRGNVGAPLQDILLVDINGQVTFPEGGGSGQSSVINLVEVPAVPFKDIAIPAGVKSFKVLIDGLSASGTSVPVARLGTSGGIQDTGYDGDATNLAAAAVTTAVHTTGLAVVSTSLATSVYGGIMEFELMSAGKWLGNWVGNRKDIVANCIGSTDITLVGDLTTVRLTMVNNTDTFDGGTAMVRWYF